MIYIDKNYEDNYKFFAQFMNVEEPHIQACLKKSGLTHIISRNAYNYKGEQLPDYSVVLIPKDCEQQEKIFAYYRCYDNLAKAYEKYVRNVVGLSKEEIFTRIRYNPILLGSEKMYFPDKLKEIYGNYPKLKKYISEEGLETNTNKSSNASKQKLCQSCSINNDCR